MSSIQPPVHLAVDLGASGGRVLAGFITDQGVQFHPYIGQGVGPPIGDPDHQRLNAVVLRDHGVVGK